jgi:cyclic-di-GMP-binding protein
MAATFSFDIVSEVNFMEVENAVVQAQKELATRFDFKGSKSSIDYNKTEKKITLIGDDDFKLRAVTDVLETRLVKRGVHLKSLDKKTPESAFEGTLRQVITITSGMPSDKAKEIVKIIKDSGIRVQAAIEGTKIRVSSPKKDDLQGVMNLLKNANLPLPVQFTNYR